jgi:hypothetical protein
VSSFERKFGPLYCGVFNTVLNEKINLLYVRMHYRSRIISPVILSQLTCSYK